MDIGDRLRKREIADLLSRWRLDAGLGMVLVLALVSAWALLARPSLPGGTDGQHHIYRAYEILSAWREGIPYPRWAPDFYYAYGYPVFNFYAPFTYYLAAAYGWLFGPVAGVKFGLVLATCLGTLGVYLFGRDQWGAIPAAVGAAAYALAPYIALTDSVNRAALPEAFAIGLGPIVLWAITRLSRAPTRRFFVAAILSLGILILSHNLMSFAFVGLTAAWLVWDTALIRRPVTAAGWIGALARPALAAVLAVGLTAFMWLPAILERGTVQYQNAFNFVQIRRYVSASELLAPVTARAAQVFFSADITFHMGLPQWILGLLGALTVLGPGPQRRATLFFAMVSLAAFGLMLPQADIVWQRVPALAYLQFSYRLLGILAPCLAWLAGAAAQWAIRRVPAARLALPTVLVAACALAAIPLLNPLPWPDFGPVTPKTILDFDLYGLWGVGTTWQGEFLPTTVRSKPAVNPAVMVAVAGGEAEKIDRAALPAGAQVVLAGHSALQDDFQISASDGFTLRVLTFFWPGWTAYLDGGRVPIQPSDPDGFITVSVPAGTHALRLRLEDTPPRRLGWIVAAATLLASAALLLPRLWSRSISGSAALYPAPLPGRLAMVTAALGVALVLVRVGLDAGQRWTAARAVPSVAGAQVHRFTRFDNGMALVAYDLPQAAARAGDAVPITFYWEVTQPMSRPASVFVHFYGPNGALRGQADKPDPVEFFPTTRWALGRVTADAELALLEPGAPPGLYTVAVGLWDRSTGQRSRLLDSAGQPTDQDKFVLTTEFQVNP